MRVLVVGSGGREHALAWLLSKDSDVDVVFAAPGNPGIETLAYCVPIEVTAIEELADFHKKEQIDLTIVGPEAPLALGIVDAFESQGLRIFGPSLAAARIETSKSFAKSLCDQEGIPRPRWEKVDSLGTGYAALDKFGPPWVVKFDGLAAGKGVAVTNDPDEARLALERGLNRQPGIVVLEEYVPGWESTILATVSGEEVAWVAPIFQDSKLIGDGDTGPNTGGMGVFMPIPEATEKFELTVRERILEPIAAGLARAGSPFRGLLSPNLMTPYASDIPYLLECNCRFGDPEIQGISRFVQSGIAQHFFEIANGSSNISPPELVVPDGGEACVNLVVASRGYPQAPEKGATIQLDPPRNENVMIFHAGTARADDGNLVVAGGRIFNIVALGRDVNEARQLAYETAEKSVHFESKYYRSDIGELGCVKPRPTLI